MRSANPRKVVKRFVVLYLQKSLRKQLTKFVERCGCTILDRFFSILGVESFFVPFLRHMEN